VNSTSGGLCPAEEKDGAERRKTANNLRTLVRAETILESGKFPARAGACLVSFEIINGLAGASQTR
jgi:hypothetical protein